MSYVVCKVRRAFLLYTLPYLTSQEPTAWADSLLFTSMQTRFLNLLKEYLGDASRSFGAHRCQHTQRQFAHIHRSAIKQDPKFAYKKTNKTTTTTLHGSYSIYSSSSFSFLSNTTNTKQTLYKLFNKQKEKIEEWLPLIQYGVLLLKSRI